MENDHIPILQAEEYLPKEARWILRYYYDLSSNGPLSVIKALHQAESIPTDNSEKPIISGYMLGNLLVSPTLNDIFIAKKWSKWFRYHGDPMYSIPLQIDRNDGFDPRDPRAVAEAAVDNLLLALEIIKEFQNSIEIEIPSVPTAIAFSRIDFHSFEKGESAERDTQFPANLKIHGYFDAILNLQSQFQTRIQAYNQTRQIHVPQIEIIAPGISMMWQMEVQRFQDIVEELDESQAIDFIESNFPYPWLLGLMYYDDYAFAPYYNGTSSIKSSVNSIAKDMDNLRSRAIQDGIFIPSIGEIVEHIFTAIYASERVALSMADAKKDFFKYVLEPFNLEKDAIILARATFPLQ